MRNQIARDLFAPIAPTYERGARILGLGQDRRWRQAMVAGLDLTGPADVLDVAAGTGSITRLLRARGHRVTSVDLSLEMLGRLGGGQLVQARAEELPFRDQQFDAVTFGYLLRYVDEPLACLTELSRVLRPGGAMGMVEFGLPRNQFSGLWQFYSRSVLPLLGRSIGPGWPEVGQFLRGSIEEFHRAYPDLGLLWRTAGLVNIRTRSLTFGAGLVMWARRP